MLIFLPIRHYQLIHIISQFNATIVCGIQLTDVITMVIKLLHNCCKMCTFDLTDMYALSLEPVALMLILTYQSNYSCTCYNHNVCMYVCMYVCVCVFVCMYVCMHACMHICMYMPNKNSLEAVKKGAAK